MAGTPTTKTVRSADGTRIAFDRTGSGRPLILIEAAAHYRDFSSFGGLVPLLAEDFTVFTYDRRGRGESTDTPPYAPDREVEDIGALIGEAGGSAVLYGYSSGALLGLWAAAGGLSVTRMALLEPPLQDDNPDGAETAFTGDLAALVEAGRPADAVKAFHEGTGVPPEFIGQMEADPSWAKMVSVAHTLVYDCRISDATTPALLASVTVPTLVLDSAGSSDDLTGWAAGVASQLPNGSHRSLPGEWHGVTDEVLAPVLIEFLRDG
jgi:pimeloyl-ACP methyl ester carboxylesterase